MEPLNEWMDEWIRVVLLCVVNVIDMCWFGLVWLSTNTYRHPVHLSPPLQQHLNAFNI